MRELPFEGQFDAVVNWFTSFGYFDPAGNLAAAKAAFAALKPGGRFLVETLNKSFVLDCDRNKKNAEELAHVSTFLSKREFRSIEKHAGSFLDNLAEGVSESDILREYPSLKLEDNAAIW